MTRQTMQKQRKQLLTLTIEIAEGQNETILIMEGDDPNQLASDFCLKHGLDTDLEQLLAE